MFTPIKNLITYIQKNASSSTFFGGTSSNTEELNSDTIMETELVNTNASSINSPPLPALAAVSEKNHDQNENEVVEDNLAVSTLTDDPLMIKEDEGEKDIFLDFPPEPENEENDVEFPTSEVIVMDDPDLNTSVNSEPGTDPLAIDDYNAHSVVSSPNPLDSSVDGGVLYMVDIDEIEANTPHVKDEEEVRMLADVKAADEQELRSDGSDSGLGSETSALQSTVTSVVDTSTCSTASSSPIIDKVPLRSNLKRRLQDVVESQQLQKKPRRSINFEGVKVFYFPRIQGHGCVPSQGGCTLGMGAHHISFKSFSLAEHAAELRRAHKLQLQEINPRGSSSEESDSDEELSEGSGSDLDAETNGFLQPVSPKQRRALLKAAGVRKIDANEKVECRDIRNSREVCGCVCRDFCDPDTCACSQAGIKCQVDRSMFPCGCSRDACGNVIGRIEFNPARVRTHFIHTIMRLEMENRQQKRTDELGSASHMVYNNVPAIASSTTAINSYNTIPSYGLEQSVTTVSHVYHHHMHQQHSAYMNHMPPAHPVSSVYASIIETPTATLALPQSPHNHYVNTTVTEPDSISSSLVMNGGALHYQDGSIYPAVQTTPLPPPPATAYGDILAPYATSSAPYHSAQVVDSGYASNVYTSYHNPHHIHNHLQQQQFLGYTTACSGDLNDYSESQSSFISLNTPEASSSRLSVINDLLHNNRNTTAALVAVSSVSNEVIQSVPPVVQEIDTYAADRNCESEEEADNDPPVSDDKKRNIEEEIEQHSVETMGRLDTPPDEDPSLALTSIEPCSIPVVESTETLSTQPKEDELPPTSSTPRVSTSSSNEIVENTNGSATDSIIENDLPATATETEEDRISDLIPPIAETVSA